MRTDGWNVNHGAIQINIFNGRWWGGVPKGVREVEQPSGLHFRNATPPTRQNQCDKVNDSNVLVSFCDINSSSEWLDCVIAAPWVCGSCATYHRLTPSLMDDFSLPVWMLIHRTQFLKPIESFIKLFC